MCHIFETGEVHTWFWWVRPEGRKALGRLSHRWEDNIKMDLKEVRSQKSQGAISGE